MRTAGLPNFMKLYGKIDTMQAGDYEVHVINNYDTKSYDGSKSLVLMTVSSLGGDNSLLAIALMAMGVLLILFGFAFCSCNTQKKLNKELTRKDSFFAVKFR